MSALDVSIQAQVINLLEDLQKEFDLTYVFIAHDLSVVKHISDRVAVMYLGKIVEVTDRKTLYNEPRHPYTASPPGHPRPRSPQGTRAPARRPNRRRATPANPPSGCHFHTRCPRAQNYCTEHEPDLEGHEKEDHKAACFFPVLEGQHIEEPPTTDPYHA